MRGFSTETNRTRRHRRRAARERCLAGRRGIFSCRNAGQRRGVAAALQPVGRHDAGGLLIELAPTYGTHEPAAKTFTIQAVLSPGKVEDIEIASFRRFKAGEEYRVSGQNCLIALDGEREIALREHEYALISLQENAFYTLDVPAVLKYVCAQKLHDV